MAYSRMLSGAYSDSEKDLNTVMQFLIQQLGAIRYQHIQHNNLIYLDKKLWWVVASTDCKGVVIGNGNKSENCELIRAIKALDAGLLLFRQLVDNRVCIYLIDNMDKLERHCESSLIFNWDTIESIKRFSEAGILMGSELIGFRQLRRLRNDTAQSHSIV